VLLNGCEYLPHSAKVDLNDEQLKQISHQADRAIITAFDKYDLVAVGDYHWNDDFLLYLTSLIKSDSFNDKVQHFIVEFGNAKYQTTLNKYLAGKDISLSELELFWRDSLYFTVWMPEVYRDFLLQYA
jgi:uncharacterized iron-regulated protein